MLLIALRASCLAFHLPAKARMNANGDLSFRVSPQTSGFTGKVL